MRHAPTGHQRQATRRAGTSIPATEFNYPCGTAELADAVADLIRVAPEPGRAIIGLKNHGLTITGPSLEEIFERVGPHIQRQVPMS